MKRFLKAVHAFDNIFERMNILYPDLFETADLTTIVEIAITEMESTILKSYSKQEITFAFALAYAAFWPQKVTKN